MKSLESAPLSRNEREAIDAAVMLLIIARSALRSTGILSGWGKSIQSGENILIGFSTTAKKPIIALWSHLNLSRSRRSSNRADCLWRR